MKYILVLLMLGGVVYAQKIVRIDVSDGDDLFVTDTANFWKRIPKGSVIDTCQKYRDSVAKYDANIKVWQRQKNPHNTQLERMATDALIANLSKQREEFVQKAKKCKP